MLSHEALLQGQLYKPQIQPAGQFTPNCTFICMVDQTHLYQITLSNLPSTSLKVYLTFIEWFCPCFLLCPLHKAVFNFTRFRIYSEISNLKWNITVKFYKSGIYCRNVSPASNLQIFLVNWWFQMWLTITLNLSLDSCTAWQCLCSLTDHSYLHHLRDTAVDRLTSMSFPREKQTNQQ